MVSVKTVIKVGSSLFITVVAFISAFHTDSFCLKVLLIVSVLLETYLSIDGILNEKKYAERIKNNRLSISINSKRIEQLESEQSFVEGETLHLPR